MNFGGGDLTSMGRPNRKNLDLNLGNLEPRLSREQEETERKFREIDNRNGHIALNGKVQKARIDHFTFAYMQTQFMTFLSAYI